MNEVKSSGNLSTLLACVVLVAAVMYLFITKDGKKLKNKLLDDAQKFLDKIENDVENSIENKKEEIENKLAETEDRVVDIKDEMVEVVAEIPAHIAEVQKKGRKFFFKRPAHHHA